LRKDPLLLEELPPVQAFKASQGLRGKGGTRFSFQDSKGLYSKQGDSERDAKGAKKNGVIPKSSFWKKTSKERGRSWPKGGGIRRS